MTNLMQPESRPRAVPLDSCEGLAYLKAMAGECRAAAAALPEADRPNAKWLELAARLYESVRNDYRRQ